MEDCRYYRQLAALRPDGELTETERGELERHLDQCPDCRDAAAAYDAMFALRRSELAEAPETLTPGILSLIKRHRKKRRFPLYPMAAAAACLTLLLVIEPWKQPAAQNDMLSAHLSINPTAQEAPETYGYESGSTAKATTGENATIISADAAEAMLAQNGDYTQALIIRDAALGESEDEAATRGPTPAPTNAMSEPFAPADAPEDRQGGMASYLYLTDEAELLRYAELYGGELLDGEAETELYLVVFMP